MKTKLPVYLLDRLARSFALTIKMLPASMREPVCLTYMIARATDSIADTELIPLNERERLLEIIKALINGNKDKRLDELLGFLKWSSTIPEAQLLISLPELLQLISTFDTVIQSEIRKVLITIISGQQHDLRYFKPGGRESLLTAQQLIDYTYCVAGCVGEFWTRISNYLFWHWEDERLNQMLCLGRNYGQGLQLVNILRDLPFDLKKGRCYLPAAELREENVDPVLLFNGDGWGKAQAVFYKWVRQAVKWLADGWHYVNEIPFACIRLRLAGAWPALLGIKTIYYLTKESAKDDFLRIQKPIKVPRKELHRLVLQTLLLVWIKPFWQGLWNRWACSIIVNV